MRRLIFSLAFALFAAPAWSEEEAPANALLLAGSEKTAFDKGFQDYLNRNGARLTKSYPPSAFIGYVPEKLDAELKDRFGVKVFRSKVEDMSDFFKSGASSVMAVNYWNKLSQDDPAVAPAVISHKVNKAGNEKLVLRWNEVMKAVSYRLQIGLDPAFNMVALDTILPSNSFDVYKPFWNDGVYYWRVAGLMVLNTGLFDEGSFSEAYSFSVSRPPAAMKNTAPALPPQASFRGGRISWPVSPEYKYYRLQVSSAKNFATPVIDVFTDTGTYKASGRQFEPGGNYQMRVMGADDAGPGKWSGASEITFEAPGLTVGKRRARRGK